MWLLLALAALASPPLAPGDVLLVSVPGEPPRRDVVVEWDGGVDLGVLGRPVLGGTPVEDVDAVVRSQLARFFRSTDGIVVRLVERRRQLLVTGAVLKPGLVVIRPGEDLLSALAAAGGPTPDADLAHVVLVPRTGAVTTIDVRARLSDAAMTLPEAFGGDTIRVPELRALTEPRGDRARVDAAAGVIVLGAVKTPGLVPVPADGRLASVLAAAGGTDPTADLEGLVVTIEGKTSTIGLGDGLRLEAGAMVFVPSRAQSDDPGGVRVTLIGGPRGGQRVRLPRDARLADAVAALGAGDGGSRLSTFSVVRHDGDSTLALSYDLDDPHDAADLLFAPLRDGDVVRVEAVASTDFERVVRIATAVGGVASAFLLVWTLADKIGAAAP